MKCQWRFSKRIANVCREPQAWVAVFLFRKKMNVREAISEASQQFGICLKEKQFDAIYEFCSGSDVFVSLPTGFGKSIIYAILPLVFDRIRGKYELITYYIRFSTITLCIARQMFLGVIATLN